MNARLLQLLSACLALSTTVGVVSGCGGSGTAEKRASVSASHSITKAQATAYARAVNLRAGDLPLASVFSGEGEGKASRATPREAACERSAQHEVNPNRRIIHRHSATLGWTLHGELAQIYSVVEVLPSAALMARHNAANRSRAALACIPHILQSQTKRGSTNRIEFESLAVHRLPDPLPGIAGSFEYRIDGVVALGRTSNEMLVDYVPQPVRRKHFYLDLFGFVSGPAEIDLLAVGIPKPVPKQLEDRLLVLLYSRTREQNL